ncbi:MAG: NUDIX domain-containing protein [Acidimicrobiia bacterium]|nr:NUDIX domain-containing protein [Acidimicrobiia bacterium]
MGKQRAPYPAWIYRQSALVPYRWDHNELHVLLISSRSGKRWVVPKGIVEPGMSPIASALKEAHEEAGVSGRAHDRLLGRYRQDKWGGTCDIAVYPLEVTDERDDWPEARRRERRWFHLDDAAREAGRRGLRRIIARLPDAVPEPSASATTETGPLPRPRLVCLLRHAKSSHPDPKLGDEERPLALRGKRACEAMSRYMSLGEVHPDLVLCSSALRTRQTLERIRPALGEDARVQHSSALYRADPRAMLGHLRGCPDDVSNVLLIGHNPGLQALALRLVHRGVDSEAPVDVAAMAAKFPTGALAILIYHGARWADLDTGGCQLHSFVSPRQIGEAP